MLREIRRSSLSSRVGVWCQDGLSSLRSGARSLAHLGLALTLLGLFSADAAFAQQRGSISGKVVDPDNLALPGATITVKEQNTGFTRSSVSAGTGAFTIPNLEPGKYTLTVSMSGFNPLTRKDVEMTAGYQMKVDLKLSMLGLAEEVTVEGEAPLVETTSNKIGGTLSKNEIEDVPSNFRNFTALTQLIPGMTPAPAASSFEGGQVVANGTPSQSNVYLLDGAYNNDDRLGGSQGTQVRVVLDNIGEYQVLSNQYSAEYGGGAGAIINMVSRGGTNDFSGRVYTYFRDDKFNTINHFVKLANGKKPSERTLQMGLGVGGPIIKNRMHYYVTIEKDNEDNVGFKTFPAAAGPMATTSINGPFTVRALNTFGRLDFQLNSSNFISVRGVREKAPTKGENFNTGTQTLDQQRWESDLDELIGLSYTTTVSDRASNVLRLGWIREQLDTGAQTFFEESTSFLIGDAGIKARGFGGRDPFSLGQLNTHPGWTTGTGGPGAQTTIHTYAIDDSFSYFIPSLWGGEHTLKFGAGASKNRSDPQTTQDSGTFTFTSDLPYNPAVAATLPTRFDIQVGPVGVNGFSVEAKDQRLYGFFEDKWRATKKLTLNLGLRYDNQKITPGDRNNIAPRAGFAYDVKGDGKTVIRGGGGRFFAYIPVSVELNRLRNGVRTLFPSLSISTANDTCNCILRPSVINSLEGTHTVAVLSPAAQADLAARRAAILAGSVFNANPSIDSPNRKMPYQWSYSFGVSHELNSKMAFTLDYVGNVSKDQLGIIDINENAGGTRKGVANFDPSGQVIEAAARTTNFGRVLQWQTNKAFDGKYNSLQFSLVKRASKLWSGRLAYTLQKGYYTGTGSPDARRVVDDANPRTDYGEFISNRRHVLATTGTITPWKTLSVSAVLSAISGARINETVGRDVNGDGDNTDRPIKDVSNFNTCAANGTVVGSTTACTPGSRVFYPILSATDSSGLAVINGIKGPKSILLDMSFRYQIHMDKAGKRSLDLFYDIFNVTNRTNIVAPSGNHASSLFNLEVASQFPRQMQFGARIRF